MRARCSPRRPVRHLRLALPVLAALAALALGTMPGRADIDGCASPIRATVIDGHLPIADPSPSRAIAAFVRPYADVPLYVDGGEAPGFRRGLDSEALFAAIDPAALRFAHLGGFYGVTFLHCSAHALVIVFDKTSPSDPRDLIAGTMRQTIGGTSPLALRFVDAVIRAYPGYAVTLVGHSSGGGLASYAAGQRGLPSLVFSPSRTRAGMTNDGANQIVVFVEHDPIADPDELQMRPFRGPRRLNGMTLRVSVTVERPLIDLHDLETVIAGLDALLAAPP